MDAPRFFTHADDTFTGMLRAGEVQVSHFGDGVTNGVVDGALTDFTAFDVGDGNT